MKILLGMLLLFCISCDCDTKKNAKKKTKNALKCYKVDGLIERCENKEVICYSRHSGGLQCKFKR